MIWRSFYNHARFWLPTARLYQLKTSDQWSFALKYTASMFVVSRENDYQQVNKSLKFRKKLGASENKEGT